MNLKICFLLLVCCFTGKAFATALEKLVGLLEPYSFFSGDFVQIIDHVKSGQKRVINGRIAISGKAYLLWETDKPFQQKIVADGKVVWIYDEDLMQVQVRSLEESFVSSPARILVGTTDEISRDFSVSEKKEDQRLSFILTPKSNDQVILSIEFMFEQKLLRELILVSALGSSTRLIMQDQLFKSPDKQVFAFKPPLGTDILYANGLVAPNDN